jgi:hypothetical protein
MRNKNCLLNLVGVIAFQLVIALPLFAQDYVATDIALTPGADASKLNFAWITNASSSDTCAVQIALASTDFRDGSAVFTSSKVTKPAFQNDAAYYYCEVEAKNLQNQTSYVYRVGDGTQWNGPYSYSTENRNKYGFVFLSDAQIGASHDVTADTAGWANTVKVIGEQFPETAFIMSAGDQVENPGNTAQLDGFFSPAELRSIPVAPTPSSHDELGNGTNGAPSSYAFDYHFNLPNESSHLQALADLNNCPPPPPGQTSTCTTNMQLVTLASGDYYFTYGKALFMVLNMDSSDVNAHRAFMQAAVNANPKARWKIAMWHYTIYTAASRGMNPPTLRTSMVSIMDDLGIDVVLMGHDHTFCRTWQMLNDSPQTGLVTDNKDEVVNPPGTFYLTADSASGSKYYSLGTNVTISPDSVTNPSWYWVAAYSQLNVPTFSYVSVDANSLKVSTYRTDTMAEIDTYSIKKNQSN